MYSVSGAVEIKSEYGVDPVSVGDDQSLPVKKRRLRFSGSFVSGFGHDVAGVGVGGDGLLSETRILEERSFWILVSWKMSSSF